MKGSLYYSGTGKQFAGDNVDDELRSQGITAGTRLLKLNDLNADGGGPILRDRLWWFGSARDYTTLEQVIGFPKDFKSNLRNYTARVNTQVGRGNQLSGFWTYNKKFQPNRGAGLTQPNPIGTINQQSPKNLFNANWTSILSQTRFLEVSSTYFPHALAEPVRRRVLRPARRREDVHDAEPDHGHLLQRAGADRRAPARRLPVPDQHRLHAVRRRSARREPSAQVRLRAVGGLGHGRLRDL
jgi:hypothetical protein